MTMTRDDSRITSFASSSSGHSGHSSVTLKPSVPNRSVSVSSTSLSSASTKATPKPIKTSEYGKIRYVMTGFFLLYTDWAQ
ncbi:hypothetical protein F5Y00DRAFT_243022 [Daldinia vernicosa]|uniref:uncharacterized protein n=1 Tax=Daldinia vernicosa TaxID=114800 RepID=UPI00200756A4|nr:uncharacterized protein F5Y00DRAFT_243022 [Daldinia vernicosa]KAI0846788.1 hypothetical protein F5Y00DRAFT_243022 [Daldinia vernicosa]